MTNNGASTNSLHSLVDLPQGERPLVRYLRNCREHMERYSGETVKIVLGNSTCDLDSAVSSLCFAYTLYLDEEASPLSSGKIILPVLNIKKLDLKYKTEVVYILKKLKIPHELLFFRDTVNLKTLAEAEKLELVLVDHHTIPEEDAVLQHSVMQVIDHRPIVKNWPLPKSMLTITQTGSCATLITGKIIARDSSLLSRDKQLPKLLFCAILLDTMNCSPVSKRYVKLDLDALEVLEPHVLSEGQTRENVYRGLLRARTNVDNFTGLEILLKDVKYACGIPICTLPYLVETFITRPDAQEALETVLNYENLEMVMLLGITMNDGTMERDIAFYIDLESELYGKVLQALNTEDVDLQVQEETHLSVGKLKVFRQKNLEKTRKHVLPILEKIIKSHKQRS